MRAAIPLLNYVVMWRSRDWANFIDEIDDRDRHLAHSGDQASEVVKGRLRRGIQNAVPAQRGEPLPSFRSFGAIIVLQYRVRVAWRLPSALFFFELREFLFQLDHLQFTTHHGVFKL
ncbi:MAG TPA: hypothetical protein VJ692_11005, partial [Nitrospiraceae bacterium]|nr:hypothetical protein [Nitrospiraceae bacterium]